MSASTTSRAVRDATPGDWDSYQYDRRNTGYAPAVEPPETAYERWRVQFGGGPRYTPVVDGDTVIVSGRDFTVCRRVDTGERVWSRDRGFDTVAGYDDTLAVGRDEDGTLVGFETATGETVWTTDAPTSFTGSVTVADDTAYLGVRDEVLAVDAATGDVRWRYTVETASGDTEIPQGTPAVTDATVFVDGGPTVHAIDAETGQRRWRRSLDGDAGPSLAATRDTLLVGGSTVRALAVSDGSTRWRYDAFERRVAVAVADDTVYVANHNAIGAVDASSGAERWRRRFGEGALSRDPTPPVVDGRYVYTPAEERLLALQPDDGETAWAFESRFVDGLAAPPALSGGGIFLASGGGVVQVLRRNEPFSGSFALDPTPPVAGEPVTFDATEVTDPDPPVTYWQGESGATPREGVTATFEWDFLGDGGVDATGREVEFTFDEPGRYEVTLRASDGTGSTTTISREVVVESPETTTSSPTDTDEATTSEQTATPTATSRDETRTSSFDASTPTSTAGTATTEGAAPGLGVGSALASLAAGAYAVSRRLTGDGSGE